MTDNIYSDDKKNQPNSFDLNILAEKKIWVAWRNELVKTANGKQRITKVPYCSPRQKAQSDNPFTWRLLNDAADLATDEFIAASGLNGKAGGGIGLCLGVQPFVEGLMLGGVDLDTCIADGITAAWAQEIIARFASYAEISPSGAGYKIFFAYREEDLETIQNMMGTTDGKKFAHTDDNGHPPAIELYLSGRYFTLTGNVPDGGPNLITLVGFDDLKWLVSEAGPRFKADDPARKIRPAQSRNAGYGSRSERAFSYAGMLRRDEKIFGYEAMKAALANAPDQGIREWYHEKGVINNERELLRLWEKIKPKFDSTVHVQRGDDEDIGGAEAVSKPILSKNTPSHSAAIFLQRYPTKLLHWRDDFYEWVGTRYVPIHDDVMEAHVYSFLNGALERIKVGKEFEEIPFRTKKQDAAEVINATKTRSLQPPSTDSNTNLSNGEIMNLIPCRNGLVDLRDGTMYSHSPDNLVLHCLDFDYDPTMAEPTAWLEFVHSLWPDDDGSVGDTISCLQEIMGYLLSGRTDQQKIFLITGEPRSGKSTISHVIRKLLGKENTVSFEMANFAREFGLMGLIGKLAVIIPDMRQGSIKRDPTTLVERLLNISGEDEISIARKFKDDWHGKLTTRIVIISNDIPKLPDGSGAIATRFIPIKTEISFLGREDTMLKQKLEAELPQIFNWSVRGLNRLTERGHFVTPATGLEAMEEVRQAAAPHLEFIEDYLVVGQDFEVEKQTVYDAYRNWCGATGHSPCANNVFHKRLKTALGLQITDYRPGRNPRRWKGIKLDAPSDRGFY